MELKFRREDESNKKVVELLREVPIFYEMDGKAIESLLDQASEETFPAKSAIVEDGSYLADLYIILSGRVEVRKKGKVIAKLGKGQFFGEMAFLNDEPTGRSADIVAVGETKCLKIKGPLWYAFLRKNPDVAIEVIRTLARRLRNTNWTLSELQNLPSTTPEK
ncbi:MAG: cyclic nucleotide-binding domain-containing protein [Thaumarchaeota archaeon]|nr:cyclic nucleotide-binding domain-containing protein [Nitrososphaerota archaeon]